MKSNLRSIGSEGIYPNYLRSSRRIPFSIRIILVIILSSVTISLLAAQGRGVRSIALAGASAAVPGNMWSLYHNPSGLAGLECVQGGLVVLPQQFGLNELRTTSFAGAIPLDPVYVGLGVERFGFELYRETSILLGFAGQIGHGVSCGITGRYDDVEVRGYGSGHFFTVNLGLQGRISESIIIAFCATNVTGTRIGSANERRPQTASLGTSYSPFESFLIVAELEKDLRYPAILKAGLERRLMDVLALRGGISTNPDEFFAGMGLTISNFQIGYAVSSHPDLGWTHGFEVALRMAE